MGILIINHEFPPLGGGAATACQNLCKNLASKGLKITVLTSAFSKLPKTEAQAGYTIMRIPCLRRSQSKSNTLEFLSFMLAATWFVLRKPMPYELCLAFFSLPAGLAALVLRWYCKIPYIISLRGGDVPGFLPKNLHLLHTLCYYPLKLIWHYADFVVANSQGLAQLAQQHTKKTITLIPNGVNLEKFKPKANSAPNEDTVDLENFSPTSIPNTYLVALQESPLPPKNNSPVQLLYTGRLNTQKSLAFIIEALHFVKTPYHLTIIGDGPLLTQLKKSAQDLPITFTGWLDRASLPAYYALADIFVFSSQDEGLPNSVLEAMAAGLACLVTKGRGTDELITPSTGLIAPKEPQAYAKALDSLLQNPQLRLQLGQAARQLVETKFNDQTTAQAYYQLFQATGDTHESGNVNCKPHSGK